MGGSVEVNLESYDKHGTDDKDKDGDEELELGEGWSQENDTNGRSSVIFEMTSMYQTGNDETTDWEQGIEEYMKFHNNPLHDSEVPVIASSGTGRAGQRI